MSALIAALAAASLASAPTSGLGDALAKQGYVAIPLRGTGVGHLYADGTLAGREAEILIDTGASNTVVDADLAKSYGLKLAAVATGGAGIGGATVAISRVEGAQVRIGDVAIGGDIFAMDFANVRASLVARGIAPPAIVLGGDAMKRLDAVLVYGEGKLYLRQTPAK